MYIYVYIYTVYIYIEYIYISVCARVRAHVMYTHIYIYTHYAIICLFTYYMFRLFSLPEHSEMCIYVSRYRSKAQKHGSMNWQRGTVKHNLHKSVLESSYMIYCDFLGLWSSIPSWEPLGWLYKSNS